MHLFYSQNLNQSYLEGEEARHCTKVLRLKNRDTIVLTDGKGLKAVAKLTRVSEKRCDYEVQEIHRVARVAHRITLAICPTRKADRNEWMTEKLTEIGVQAIEFILSDHSHHATFHRTVNLNRLDKIAVSAIKQSQQYFLPELALHTSFKEFIDQNETTSRYIAYVDRAGTTDHLINVINANSDVVILIGPEGDFSAAEIALAVERGYIPVSLGDNRLRTETAAIAACHIANLAQIHQKYSSN